METNKAMQAQSWLSTVMRGKFTMYETRIFSRIVESIQPTITEEGGVKACIGRQISTDQLNNVYEVRIKDLMTQNAHRYSDVKNALEGLLQKEVIFTDESKQEYKASYFINNFAWNSKRGTVQISVPKWLLALILDFKKGASIYDLNIAITFRKASTIRLYMLLSGNKRPVTYSIKFLRSMLGVSDDKYTQTRDFIKRCIMPAKNEMDERGCNSFELQANKNGNYTRSAVTSITFTPIKREGETKQQAAARVNIGLIVPVQLRRYLTTQAGFELEEMKANKVTLNEFSKIDDYQDRIVSIVERSRKTRAGKGYIINAMKSEIKQSKQR